MRNDATIDEIKNLRGTIPNRWKRARYNSPLCWFRLGHVRANDAYRCDLFAVPTIDRMAKGCTSIILVGVEEELGGGPAVGADGAEEADLAEDAVRVSAETDGVGDAGDGERPADLRDVAITLLVEAKKDEKEKGGELDKVGVSPNGKVHGGHTSVLTKSLLRVETGTDHIDGEENEEHAVGTENVGEGLRDGHREKIDEFERVGGQGIALRSPNQIRPQTSKKANVRVSCAHWLFLFLSKIGLLMLWQV